MARVSRSLPVIAAVALLLGAVALLFPPTQSGRLQESGDHARLSCGMPAFFNEVELTYELMGDEGPNGMSYVRDTARAIAAECRGQVIRRQGMATLSVLVAGAALTGASWLRNRSPE